MPTYYGDIAKAAKGARVVRESRRRRAARVRSLVRVLPAVDETRYFSRGRFVISLPRDPRSIPPTHPTHPSPRVSASADLLTGGFNYDNKYTFDAKNVADGVKINVNATQKDGLDDPVGAAKTTMELDKNLVLEAEVALPSGKIAASIAHAGVIDGLKTTISANPKDFAGSLKIANQFARGGVGLKTDVADVAAGAPKTDASACFVFGDVALGATAAFDGTTMKPTKVAVAAQFTPSENLTLAATLADADVLKASVVASLDAKTTAGAEVTFKTKKRDVSAALAASRKFSAACVGKVAVSSPLPVNGGALARSPYTGSHTTAFAW
jgi:voltage-dependent anion channel protein 2